MKLSDIRVRFVDKPMSKLKAVVSLTIDDCFAVHDIRIVQGAETVFVAMPSRKTPDGEFKDIVHPINSQAREEICSTILAAYEEALKNKDAE